jgi:carboxypeptidase Q
MMRNLRSIPIALVTCVLLCGAGDDVQQRLAGRAFGATPPLEDLHELCDGIGGRPTGSLACERAIAWASAKFKAAGADSVTTETFTVPKTWVAESAEAECLAPERFALRIVAAPHSGSTNGAIEARLVDAGEGSPEAFAKLGDASRGAIALISSREMKTLDDLFAEYLKSGPW